MSARTEAPNVCTQQHTVGWHAHGLGGAHTKRHTTGTRWAPRGTPGHAEAHNWCTEGAQMHTEGWHTHTRDGTHVHAEAHSCTQRYTWPHKGAGAHGGTDMRTVGARMVHMEAQRCTQRYPEAHNLCTQRHGEGWHTQVVAHNCTHKRNGAQMHTHTHIGCAQRWHRGTPRGGTHGDGGRGCTSAHRGAPRHTRGGT